MRQRNINKEADRNTQNQVETDRNKRQRQRPRETQRQRETDRKPDRQTESRVDTNKEHGGDRETDRNRRKQRHRRRRKEQKANTMWAGVCGPRVRTGQGGQRVRGAGRGRGQSVGRDSEVMAGEDLRETALFANRHEAFADQDLRYRYQKIQKEEV